MKVGYIVKSHGHSIEDTIYFKDGYSIDDEDDKRELVNDACVYAWSCNDGWEWLRDNEIITLIVDDAEQGDFPVEVEFKPSFIVRQALKCSTK